MNAFDRLIASPRFEARATSGSMEQWTRKVQQARDCGQMTCVLTRLRETVDYEWNGGGFRFTAGSPYAAGNRSKTLCQWIDACRIGTLDLHVPIREGRSRPIYPLDYGPCGYLVAAWFQPHPLDRDRLERDQGHTPRSLAARLDRFTAMADRSAAAGQLECALMPVTGGYDYTGSEDLGYQLDASRFAPVMQWARARDSTLFVRVPRQPALGAGPLDPDIPCAFGHLVCSWEVPPSCMTESSRAK